MNASVATTEARPVTEPTDRSMPPEMMTRVMPMLMTPMIDAWRRIVSTLLTLVKVSGAVTAPTITRISRATTRPRFRPTEPESTR
jgi:hypothetical protein